MAEITGAKVIASIDVTDQSMGRGRNFRDKEYSRRTWVRFLPGETPERLNTKVIDANGVKTPLVKELGKTWYVRLPDAECKLYSHSNFQRQRGNSHCHDQHMAVHRGKLDLDSASNSRCPTHWLGVNAGICPAHQQG